MGKQFGKYEFELPRNFDYEKAMRGWSSIPPTKEEFEKKYITTYDVNDFELLDAQDFIVVGDSYGKPWIAYVDLNKGIVWNWDPKDSRYFKWNENSSQHDYSLYSVIQTGTKLLISGISEEENYKKGGFTKFINTFVREIELKK